MSAATKIAGTYAELPAQPEVFADRTGLQRPRRLLGATLLFVILVMIGSLWAVSTMQYYDEMGAFEQQQSSSLQALHANLGGELK